MQLKKLNRTVLALAAVLLLTGSAFAGDAFDDNAFNAMYSDKVMGYTFDGKAGTFRLFVPRGKTVEVLIFDKFEDTADKAKVIPMINDGNQVFEAKVTGPLWGKFYGYRITERTGTSGPLMPKMAFDTIFADPYSKATAQNNVFPQKSRTLILDTSKFNWEGDKFTGQKVENAIIMEAHLRDLTAHPAADVPDMANKGSYLGFLKAKTGGLAYLKNLGVNAVEFLPIQDFGNIEPPYNTKTDFYPMNKWNTYAQNYWGYMTSNFFAPESYFASNGTLDPAAVNGLDGRAVDEFKEVVKATHKAGMAVIMDVVYNHVSQYDENALKIIDWDFYFKKVDATGCGNEVNTNRKMVRKLINDSLAYWMKEYHVDGFRFDLASSFSKTASEEFRKTILAINPNGFVIAEPWGGEGTTTKADFDKMGWSRWNDDIRNKLRAKTRPTVEEAVFGFGTGAGIGELDDFWTGGAYGAETYQQVSYAESHDDATLGDALRVMSGEYKIYQADKKSPNRITDLDAYLKLSDNLMKANKVTIAALMLCQGPLMLHIGQEWARGKVVPDLTGKVAEILNKGKLAASSDNVAFKVPTFNSYSADNETNWIDFSKVKLNQELYDYYKGLIALRKAQPLLGGAAIDQVELMPNDNAHAGGTAIGGKIYGFVNTDRKADVEFEIPAGKYSVVVDDKKAGTAELRVIDGPKVKVPAGSALILLKK